MADALLSRLRRLLFTRRDMYQPPILAAGLLIGWRPVPINLIMPDRIPSFPATVAGVALYGVDKAILYFLYNTYMIGQSVLTVSNVPIKEYNVAGARLIAVILPESPVFEPLCAVDATGELGDHASVDIPALIGTPGYKAGAPVYMRAETIP